MDKVILDATCGGRMFWFNKHHPRALYIDKRVTAIGHIKQRNSQHNVNPDIKMDFTNMDFPDKKFKLVVWDPPHLKILNQTSILAKKYGCLNAETWQHDLKKGFQECWRVLEDYGVLVFKWNEAEIPLKKVLKLFSQDPLFGHPIHSKTKTHWLVFMKFPENNTTEVKDNGRRN